MTEFPVRDVITAAAACGVTVRELVVTAIGGARWITPDEIRAIHGLDPTDAAWIVTEAGRIGADRLAVDSALRGWLRGVRDGIATVDWDGWRQQRLPVVNVEVAGSDPAVAPAAMAVVRFLRWCANS